MSMWERFMNSNNEREHTMIKRNLLENLREWANKRRRKPLVVRGARQVGKTTLIKEFAKGFDGFVLLNMERENDHRIFEDADTPKKIFEIIRLTRLEGMPDISGKRILLFIDEIQACPRAIGMLRYFYEDLPELYVIAAGSRLQELFKTGVSFPVGRVEYMNLRPCFFDEFLVGVDRGGLSDMVRECSVGKHLHEEVSSQFQTYALTGGMPEIVTEYKERGSVAALSPIYKGLLQSYDEDVEKYAVSQQQVSVLRHLLRSGWGYAGQTVSFARFGGSSFTSTAVHQSFEMLEKAFLVSLDYPVTSVRPPLEPSLRRFPKLIWLDSGLVNFSAGVQTEYLTNTSLNDVWRGHAAEQIVGQELREPLDRMYADDQNFWVRDKNGTTAEVDFVIQIEGMVIPIEVKSGVNARLRSMQSFMSLEGACGVGIRVWPGHFSVDETPILSTGRTYRLINLPFYYVGQLDRILGKLL